MSRQCSKEDSNIVVLAVLNNFGVAETEALLDYYGPFGRDACFRHLDLLSRMNDNAEAGL